MKSGNSSPVLEELGFKDSLQDSELLPRLANSVKRWTSSKGHRFGQRY